MRGRPKIYTDEELKERRKASAKANKAKYKTMVIDGDLVGILNDFQDELEKSLGVRLTHSQTLRYLIKQARKGLGR
jgi:hypothetical protein